MYNINQTVGGMVMTVTESEAVSQIGSTESPVCQRCGDCCLVSPPRVVTQEAVSIRNRFGDSYLSTYGSHLATKVIPDGRVACIGFNPTTNLCEMGDYKPSRCEGGHCSKCYASGSVNEAWARSLSQQRTSLLRKIRYGYDELS